MSGKNKLFMISTIILILFSFISCKSKEERSIISQIQKNGFVDLSIYCKKFDKIIIYDEGYYYYYYYYYYYDDDDDDDDDNNKDEWIGQKIYYFFDGKVEKIINIRSCPADVPYGTIIYFYP